MARLNQIGRVLFRTCTAMEGKRVYFYIGLGNTFVIILPRVDTFSIYTLFGALGLWQIHQNKGASHDKLQ